MLEKKSGVRMAREVSRAESVPDYKVAMIIKGYVELQKERLNNNEPIELFGLVKIAPSRNSEIKNTIGTDSRILSERLNIPVYTISTVISSYLRNIRSGLRKPWTAYTISGICTFKHYIGSEGVPFILTRKTAGLNPSMRVFTSRFLTKMEEAK